MRAPESSLCCLSEKKARPRRGGCLELEEVLVVLSDSERSAQLMASAASIVDDAWQELRSTHFVQEQTGTIPERLPDVSFAEAERRSAVGRSLLARLESLEWERLPHELALTLRLVRFRATTWSREAQWYWHVSDPRGIGFFALFLPTAYAGGWLLSILQNQLAALPLTHMRERESYLELITDYARLIHQFADRT